MLNTHKQPDNITRFPFIILTAAFLITFFSFLWLGFYSLNSLTASKEAMTKDLRAVELRGLILQLDEVLTMSARMGVITGDPKWEKRYDFYDPILVNAITEAEKIVPMTTMGEMANRTNIANEKLVKMEREAFALSKEGKQTQGRELLFSQEYETQKKIYKEGMESYGKLLHAKSQSYIDLTTHRTYYSFIIILISFIVLAIAWFITFKSITKWKFSLEKALHKEIEYKNQLEEAKQLLEQRVKERTKELADKNLALEVSSQKATELHNQLMVAARSAGMADIATSVMHNIGNVLNSINISVGMINNNISHSKMKKFEDAMTSLLDKNNLDKFLENKNQIDDLVKYLHLLSLSWKEENELAAVEINALTKNIDHIKNIIAMQQTMSKKISINEEINLTELIEDALTLHKNACDRESINIVRDFSFEDTIIADKVKLLQVLVNLIKNAIDSLIAAPTSYKELTIRTAKANGTVEILVEDNGCGFPQEHAAKIFSYGFTTKKEGHGFGLHTSALAMKEMGGNLSATSSGINGGATFSLRLPPKPTDNNDS